MKSKKRKAGPVPKLTTQYRKVFDPHGGAEEDGCWHVERREEDDQHYVTEEVLATVNTETMANHVLHLLRNPTPQVPDLPASVWLDENDGTTPYYCQNCGHEEDEEGFWPSDGNPAPHVCPKCGSTDCFTKEDEHGMA